MTHLIRFHCVSANVSTSISVSIGDIIVWREDVNLSAWYTRHVLIRKSWLENKWAE